MEDRYDPAKVAGDPTFTHCMSVHCAICGPAGKTTIINHNERGILQTHLHEVIDMHMQAELGSNHDSHKQGIYTTNSVGDND